MFQFEFKQHWDAVYRALVGLLPGVNPHVDEEFVAGVKGLEHAWTPCPEAGEVFALALVHMQLLYVLYQLLLLVIHSTAVQPSATVAPTGVLPLPLFFLQHGEQGQEAGMHRGWWGSVGYGALSLSLSLDVAVRSVGMEVLVGVVWGRRAQGRTS